MATGHERGGLLAYHGSTVLAPLLREPQDERIHQERADPRSRPLWLTGSMGHA